MTRSFARLWYLLRFHRPSQLAMRAVRIVQRKAAQFAPGRPVRRLPAPPVLRAASPGPLPRCPAFPNWLPEASAVRAQAIREGRFQFLQVERHLPDPIDWRLAEWPDAPRLWRFHLHYHDFLAHLAAHSARTGDPQWVERAWDIVGQWIRGNPRNDPRGHLDAWHPYCVSRRVPVWFRLWRLRPPPDALRHEVLQSLFTQVRFLEKRLEWDLGGNHLMENLRALVLAGCFFDGPDAERWLRKGARFLKRQLDQQILPHGEHFERSPMYHAQMLEVVLDLRDATGPWMPELAKRCRRAAESMACFLEAILHPDGDIPLLADSALGQTAPPRELIAWAHRAPPSPRPPTDSAEPAGSEPAAVLPASRRVGDYWIYRDRDAFVLFDAGPVAPDHLPAHGHADLLTIEASWRGRRLIVDSGVFNYQDDPMRQYCRSTGAHNVLMIDGLDQCDLWSRFRMGYRGWPTPLKHGQTKDFHWAWAEHNAYRRAGVPRVGRWLACRPEGPWLAVDWAVGRGVHRLESRLHLHPDAKARMVDSNTVGITFGGSELCLAFFAAGRVEITEGWYCPEFGRRLAIPVLRWFADSSLPAFSGWSLTWGSCRGTAVFEAGKRPTLRWTDAGGDTLFPLPAGTLLGGQVAVEFDGLPFVDRQVDLPFAVGDAARAAGE